VSSNLVRSATTEATNHGKTRSGGLGSRARDRGERECAVRAFRDIHGTEFQHLPDTVVVDVHRDAAGHDDVLRRHWLVVCADRRGVAGREGLG
jgi:hypothetical protein